MVVSFSESFKMVNSSKIKIYLIRVERWLHDKCVPLKSMVWNMSEGRIIVNLLFVFGVIR